MSDDITVSPRPNLLWRVGVLAGLGTLTTLSVSDAAWQQWEDNVGDAVPRSTMRNLVVGTVAVHAVEALSALRSARAGGLDRPGRWARLTFLFGFPVLLRLRKARRLELAAD